LNRCKIEMHRESLLGSTPLPLQKITLLCPYLLHFSGIVREGIHHGSPSFGGFSIQNFNSPAYQWTISAMMLASQELHGQ